MSEVAETPYRFDMPVNRNVIGAPVEPSFRKVGITGRIYDTSALTNRTQHFLVDTETGHETTIVEHGCDFVYFVIEGQGTFLVDGQSQSCGPNDLIVIPAGTPFTYEGRLRMLVASTPPWREAQEQTL